MTQNKTKLLCNTHVGTYRDGNFSNLDSDSIKFLDQVSYSWYKANYSPVNFTREHVGGTLFLHFSNSLVNMLAKLLVNILDKLLVNLLAKSLVNLLAEALVSMLAEAMVNVLAKELMNIHVVWVTGEQVGLFTGEQVELIYENLLVKRKQNQKQIYGKINLVKLSRCKN